MSQALKTTGDAGKTYTPVRWLPPLRISGQPRPHTALREDAVTVFLGAFTLVALFWTGSAQQTPGVAISGPPPHIAITPV